MDVVIYDASDARAQLVNQEARVQRIRLEETYVQYSEYFEFTECDVRMQIDGHSARLQDWRKSRSNIATVRMNPRRD